jgi:carbamoyltransferase
MANISFYGSHNGALVVEDKGKILEVIEFERFLNRKNAGYSQYFHASTRKYLMKNILRYIEKKYSITHFDKCFYLNTETVEGEEYVCYEQLIPAYEYIGGLHHLSHAASGLYQSNYNNCLIVSFDGGGNDGFFNLYYVPNRRTIEFKNGLNLDFGFAYMIFGHFLADIKQEPGLGYGNLVYAGKIMGLCSYGKINYDWLPHFEDFYRQKPDGNNYISLLSQLSEKINIIFNSENRLVNQMAWDVAKTSQVAFENVFLESTQSFFDEYPNIPIILVGGCALNILLNTRLKKDLNREIFIPPNPNDCGIASGLILNYLKPKQAVDLTYSGVSVLDEDSLMGFLEEWWCPELEMPTLVEDLLDGKIVGIVRGNSEHGPRALGNRSIICSPTFPDMKDILNQKVKNREWYRPFAPVVRLEDVNKFFDFEGESRWMSFCPQVKDEWKETLSSVTHVDGTARVQTVTKEQNEWMYNLLTMINDKTGVGVLLNTSFNVNGKPILSKYSDAIEVFEKTNMDCLVLDNFYKRK